MFNIFRIRKISLFSYFYFRSFHGFRFDFSTYLVAKFICFFFKIAFFETMGVNYILPVAECDLKITSKQQYGIISGVWFAGK